jgi:hypothetical protein
VKFPLEEWRRGEIPTADKLNQPVNALNMIASQLGTEGSGLTTTQTPHGRILNLDLTRGVADVFFGRVVEFGPNGEDYADFDEKAATYWVERQAINANIRVQLGWAAFGLIAEKTAVATAPGGESAPYHPLIIPAINLAEAFATGVGGLVTYPKRLEKGSAIGLCFSLYDNGGHKYHFFHSTQYALDEQEIGDSAADEGEEAADTTEWNVEDDETGPCIWLYGYKRQLKFDRGGRLYEVTGETRYTIDTPTDCPPPE